PLSLGSARANAGLEMTVDPVGHEELRVLRPAVAALRYTNLFVAQGLAVRLRSVLLVRRPITDMTVQNDKSRTAFRVPGDFERALDSVNVIGIAYAQHIPAIGEESRGYVLREGNVGIAFDGDVVVVVNPAEVIETEVSGEGGSFRRDPLHHAAIAADRVDS